MRHEPRTPTAKARPGPTCAPVQRRRRSRCDRAARDPHGSDCRL